MTPNAGKVLSDRTHELLLMTMQNISTFLQNSSAVSHKTTHILTMQSTMMSARVFITALLTLTKTSGANMLLFSMQMDYKN
jgi:hypothetical protein